MAKIKKTFDRESMYKKIMPTNLKTETDELLNEAEDEINEFKEKKETKEQKLDHFDKKTNKETSIFQNKELNIIKEEKSEVILYNITEKLVLNKLDATLKKMNCCKCDRCKKDIVAISLNNLKPMYFVATKEDIKQKIHELKDLSSEVTTEVIKAVLIVRKNPRH